MTRRIFILALFMVLAAQGALAAFDIKTVDSINAATLPPGRHHLYVDAGTRPGGAPLLVPVIVIKGSKEGERLLLTAAVHGDELNGIAVIHDLAEKLQPNALSGSVIMVPGLNQLGIERHSRFFFSADNGGQTIDLNRIMPGARNPRSAAEKFVSRVWHDVLLPNADRVIDLHTQSRGTSYPLFVFADFRNPEAKKMALDLMPDVIKDDKGEAGTIETSFINKGIPAVTFEIGAPKIFQDKMIKRAVRGLENVMISAGLLEGKPRKALYPPVIGTQVSNVVALRGGLARIRVKLMQKIKAGDLIATIYTPFGTILDEYRAPVDGLVLALATDPIREPSSLLVRILR